MIGGGKFMKKINLHVGFVLLLLVTFIMVGCSSSDKGIEIAQDGGYVTETAAAVSQNNAAGFDVDASGEMDAIAEEKGEALEDGIGSDASANVLYDSNDKIIRKVWLGLETQAFDELIKSIETQVSELGGYIESSNITGRHYHSDNLRYGAIAARIPKETVDGFVNNIGEIANITQKSEDVENVTLQYVDLESRTEALEIEQERLLVLLERAEDIEVIISLETRLTNVRYELQSLKTQTRTIDNLVDYSTITMEIQEVRLMSGGLDTEESIGDRIGRGLEKTFYNMKEGLANFIVWFVVSLPYIIIWLVIIFIILFLIRRLIGKRKFRKKLKYMDYGEAKSQDNKEYVNQDLNEEVSGDKENTRDK